MKPSSVRPILMIAAGFVVVLIAHLPGCSHRPPVDPHAGEKAWVNEAGDLIVARGYVLTTAGDCAALSDPTLPPVPFEEVEKCFQPAHTPRPSRP